VAGILIASGGIEYACPSCSTVAVGPT
jgi:hypothetical protein